LTTSIVSLGLAFFLALILIFGLWPLLIVLCSFFETIDHHRFASLECSRRNKYTVKYVVLVYYYFIVLVLFVLLVRSTVVYYVRRSTL
jgi:hypothetical protein